ncbi:serine hydrolase domain-containing protein [Pontibacter sp. G13]|uniref:serine hydrolase domain-containing protein n=1 Tax=Pontibacter sp. G13 TaxID=3074898 RepID=UPI0028898131|nr:serine hydrolase domain-containing protein [Pontibacter sp. G13]WNJ19228.1 serine hydrolase domain-containing protein [Pontibacter sp. G13]
MRFLSLLISCLLVTPIMAQSPHSDFAKLCDSFDIAGASIIAWTDSGVSLACYHGWSQIDQKIPVGPETRYRIASISKLAVALVVMKQVEKGKLRLDDQIGDLLGYPVFHPIFPDLPITLRHLLQHTSGLADGPEYVKFLRATYAAENPALAELIQGGGTEEMWTEAEPGTQFRYSNLGYGIIGAILERTLDARFDEVMKTELLVPLGIQGSFNKASLPERKTLSTLYRRNEGEWVPQVDDWEVEPTLSKSHWESYQNGHNGIEFGPQGGLRVSAQELMEIGKLWLSWEGNESGALLGKSHLAQMASESMRISGQGAFKEYGLGLHITEALIPGVRLIGHTGDAYGLHSMLWVAPAEGKGFVVLLNSAEVKEGESGFYEVEEALANWIWGLMQN